MKQLLLLALCTIITGLLSAQPEIGLINDFEDNSRSGWSKGNSINNPEIIASGGPSGEDDGFLRLESDGSGSGGKWLIYNTSSAWTGNWSDAGIEFIQMDVRNNSNTEVTMRLALGTSNRQMNNGGIFSSGVSVPANSDWMTIEIPVGSGEFIGGNALNTLSNVGVIRILHNNNPSWRGAAIVASIDLDNITTVGESVIEDLVISCTTIQNVSTPNGSDGIGNVNISGGNQPYTIDVSGNAQNGVIGDNQLDNLTAGTYDIMVIDSSNVSASCSFEIIEPDPMPLTLNCMVTQQVSSNGGMDGAVSLSFEGGVSPYMVTITNGDFSENINSEENSIVFENLSAGSYQATVEDATDQSAFCNFNITEPVEPSITENFTACLTAKNQINLVQSLAFGEFSVIIRDDTVSLNGNISGLSSPLAVNIAGGAHIHQGYQGQNGPVVFPLTIELDADSLGGTFTEEANTFILDSTIRDALVRRNLYINIHTQRFPSGEIRGQIVPQNDELYSSNILGIYAHPSIMTQAQGSAIMDLIGDQLTLSGSFSNLEGDYRNAHIHIGRAGENGGVAFPLSVDVDQNMRSGILHPSMNTFTLSAEEIVRFENREYYINIHSARVPSGEIRGQIVIGKARNVFRAALAGSNVIPRAMTEASGMMIAEVMNDTVIHLSGSFGNLEGALATNIAGGSHLHNGMPGTNREVLTPLTVTQIDSLNGYFAYTDNQFNLQQNDISRLYNRGVYVNVHTNRFPGGEIRGQFLPESHIIFDAYLSSIFASPNTKSRGIGKVKATLRGNVLQLNGSFNNLTGKIATEIAGGAHIHRGFGGNSGEVVFPLNLTIEADSISGRFRPQDNRFELDSVQIALLRNRALYVNIHSEHSNSGELRGQLLGEANIYFAAPLSGASTSDPANTGAGGMALFELAGNRLIESGSFRQLNSNLNVDLGGGAHVHFGLAGTNGGVIRPLNAFQPVDSTSGIFLPSNHSWSVSEGFIDTLRARAFYVNIHSKNIASGEIRGQILPFANAYYTAYLSGKNQPIPNSSEGKGQVKVELNGNKLLATGSFENLSSPINSAVAGGAHIHMGSVGSSGGVAYALKPALSPDSLSGRFLSARNTGIADSLTWIALNDQSLYVNIHSQDYPGGEIRGQILREINFFPSSSSIVSPEDGSIIEIDPNNDMPFTVVWSSSEDRDPLAYFWQFSPDSSFSNLVFTVPTSNQTQVLFDNDSLSTILTNLGIEQGDSVTIYHRVISTDGSLRQIGDIATATLVNGIITSTIILDKSGLALTLFPNPAQVSLNIRFSEVLSENIPIFIYDLGGKLLKQDIIPGQTIHKIMDITDLPPNLYLLRVGDKSVTWAKL